MKNNKIKKIIVSVLIGIGIISCTSANNTEAKKETRFKKVNDTTIQHVGNKTVKSSDNSIIIADETTYIKAIYGINY